MAADAGSGAAADQESGPGSGRAAMVLLLILVLAVGTFAATRALRSADDIVNSVQLTPEVPPGKGAAIVFDLTRADPRADVLIIDEQDRQVRALQLGEELAAGRRHFHWDARGDDGDRVPPGPYALQVILGEQERDIRPPGRIEVLPRPAPGADS